MQETLNLEKNPPLHKTSVITSADINILVACEESQAVTIELRKLGFNAFSCDLMPCSGGHPEWHIQGDGKTMGRIFITNLKKIKYV